MMFSNKALAVFFVLCATTMAVPIVPRSLDYGTEDLVARGPHDPPYHPASHPSSSSSHHSSQPIPVPHHSGNPAAHPPSHAYGNPAHPPSHAHGSPAHSHSSSSSGSYHSAHESPYHSPAHSAGHSPGHSSGHSPAHSVYGTPPHPAQHSIDAIKAAGHKIDEHKTIHAWPLNRHVPGVHPQTTHAWLEEGNSRAGMQHVLRHEGEFNQRGVPTHEIPHHLQHVTQTGHIAGLQGRGDGRPIYRHDHNGHDAHTAVTLGNNGFVVGANPTSSSRMKPAEKNWAQYQQDGHDANHYAPGGHPYRPPSPGPGGY